MISSSTKFAVHLDHREDFSHVKSLESFWNQHFTPAAFLKCIQLLYWEFFFGIEGLKIEARRSCPNLPTGGDSCSYKKT